MSFDCYETPATAPTAKQLHDMEVEADYGHQNYLAEKERYSYDCGGDREAYEMDRDEDYSDISPYAVIYEGFGSRLEFYFNVKFGEVAPTCLQQQVAEDTVVFKQHALGEITEDELDNHFACQLYDSNCYDEELERQQLDCAEAGYESEYLPFEGRTVANTDVIGIGIPMTWDQALDAPKDQTYPAKYYVWYVVINES